LGEVASQELEVARTLDLNKVVRWDLREEARQDPKAATVATTLDLDEASIWNLKRQQAVSPEW
jgi:hypothetical protein